MEGLRWVEKLGGGEGRDWRAVRVGGSQRSSTPTERRAWATVGQIVFKRDSWTRSVSAALHAAG